MSEENVEVVRRTYEAWSVGDFGAEIDVLDQHVTLVVRRDFPEFGVFVGVEGVREFMRRFLDQWHRLTIEADDTRAIGDTVVARVTQHGQGRSSGIEGDTRYFQLFTFRGGKIVRIETVMSEREALEAAGLA